jgi:hypothetical protein
MSWAGGHALSCVCIVLSYTAWYYSPLISPSPLPLLDVLLSPYRWGNSTGRGGNTLFLSSHWVQPPPPIFPPSLLVFFLSLCSRYICKACLRLLPGKRGRPQERRQTSGRPLLIYFLTDIFFILRLLGFHTSAANTDPELVAVCI